MSQSDKLTIGIDVGSASIKAALVRDTAAGPEFLLGRSQRIRRREARDVVDSVFKAVLSEAELSRDALDYIIELNKKGVEILEKTASLFLTRILTDDNPNFMDLRNPCGAAIGQLAYNYDGRVYTCDEARMVSEMGDDLFCIGNVAENTYDDVIHHDSVGSLCLASCLESLPGCSDCAYNPFCGVCPVYNFQMQGDLFALQPDNDRCKVQMGIQDYLFTLLRDGGDEIRQLLDRWTIERDRSAVYRRND